jgi:hypothetical protein
MRTISHVAAAVVIASAGFAINAHAQPPRAGAAASAIDRDALAALDRMGAYLRTLKAFQIRSTTTVDDVLDDGQRIQNDGTVDMLVQRPNRLRVEVTSDSRHRMYFYDGKTFAIWARLVNYYATVPAPPTLAELGERLADRYGIELPLEDLFYWGSDKSSASGVTAAADIGASQIDGISCEHYAFRQQGLDWQVWIQAGEFPLPRKLVLTTTTDEARPQYSTVMSWNLAPAFNDAAFTFVPPPDAHKIVLADLPTSR